MRSKEILHVSASLGLVLAALLACKGKKDDGSGGATTTTSGDPASGNNGAPADNPPPGDKPGKGCTLPDSIHADFTVTKGCATKLKGAFFVYDEATLTIEPGVKILAETDSYLWVDKGKLVVKGTAAEPVTFTSANSTKAPGDWVGIGFREGVMAGSSIEHAIIEYAGSKNNNGEAAIKLETMRQGKRIAISDTTIKDSGQFGIMTDENGAFARFENNQLSGNKKGSLNVTAEVIGSIGKGNKFVDPIHVRESRIDESTTWPAVDVPILVDNHIRIGSDTSVPILTIADKTTVKVAQGIFFWVAEGGPGGIVAKNVTFTSSSPAPAEGDWVGIILGPKPSGTDIENCTFEYAGQNASGGHGAITFWAGPAKDAKGVKIENNTFKANGQGAIGSPDNDCGPFGKAGNKLDGTGTLCAK